MANSSAFLKRTFTTPTNQNKWTFSFWYRRGGSTGAADTVFANASTNQQMWFTGSVDATFNMYTEGYIFTTSRMFRDGEWYHVVVAIDTSASGTNKVRLYVNGTEETSFALDNRSTFGGTSTYNSAVTHNVGCYNSSNYTNGSLCDVFFVDGQQLTPDVFGKVDTSRDSQWAPRHPTAIKNSIGAFGNNGFYLPLSSHSVTIPDVTGNYTFGPKVSSSLMISGERPNTTIKKSFGFWDNTTGSNTCVQSSAGLSAGHVISSSEDFTIEFWIKYPGDASTNERIFANYTNNGDACYDLFIAGGGRSLQDFGAALSYNLSLRDNQWDHVAICRQSGTGRYYLNGVQQSSAANSKTYGQAGYKLGIGGCPSDHGLGAAYGMSKGMIAAFKIRKGTCSYLNGTSFTPPATFTNDSGTIVLVQDTTNSAVGIDNSSTGLNGFTAVKFTDPSNVIKDSPKNSFNTHSFSNKHANLQQTDGGLTLLNNSGGVWYAARSTHAFSTGKWYWECKFLQGNSYLWVALDDTDEFARDVINNASSSYEQSYGYQTDGRYWTHSSAATGNPTSSVGDVIMCAVDADAGKMYFGKNGTWFGTAAPASNTGHHVTIANNHRYTPTAHLYGSGTHEGSWNFGQGLLVTSNSGNGYSDGNGYGKFQYQPPAGFNSLCDANINNITTAGLAPETYFNAVLYAGNSTNGRQVTGVGFRPDMVWIKSISGSVGGHHWRAYDSARSPSPGTSPYALPWHLNTQTADGTYADDARISSWDADGFTLSTYNNNNGCNLSGENYIAYCWKKIAGAFDCITYTGDGASTRAIAHNLGVTPDFVTTKSGQGSDNGRAWFREGPTPSTQYMQFALPSAYSTADSQRITGANTSTFSVTGNVDPYINATGRPYVAWLFASKPGFSKVGTYIGNNSADGPVIYCGFKPAMVIIKSTASTESWYIHDFKRGLLGNRNPNNRIQNLGDSAYSITGSYDVDLISNGFKIRTSHPAWNGSGVTYVYIAFAETPHKYANGY